MVMATKSPVHDSQGSAHTGTHVKTDKSAQLKRKSSDGADETTPHKKVKTPLTNDDEEKQPEKRRKDKKKAKKVNCDMTAI